MWPVKGCAVSVKRFKGTKKCTSYKEMCAFLNIEAALRGPARQKQLSELRKYYDIETHKGGRYTLTYLTQQEREHRDGISSGKIKVIDGYEVNLKAPTCYEHTKIDQTILYFALNYNAETFAEFLAQCFGGCRYFRHILSQSTDEQYSFNALCKRYWIHDHEADNRVLLTLSATDDLIRDRLKKKVENSLSSFEQSGFIQVKEVYLLSDYQRVGAELIQPYVDQAYKNLGFQYPSIDMKSKAKREAFKKERNKLYQVDYPDKEIWRKEFQITPLLSPQSVEYPSMTEDELNHSLTLFFNVLREKLLYTVRMATNRIGFPAVQPNYGKAFALDTMAKAIIQTYCVFEADANESQRLQNYNFYAVSNFIDQCKPRFHEPEDEKSPENLRDL